MVGVGANRGWSPAGRTFALSQPVETLPRDAGSRIDGLAYAALVMGVVSLVFNLFLFGPPALLLGPGAAIMGFISRRRVANSGGTLRGGTIALAGLILGIIGFAVNVAWLFLIVVVFGPGIRERSSG